MEKYLYITLETKVRELDSKVFLAIEAIKRGYIVILGTKRLMHKVSAFGNEGIYLYKDATPQMEHIFKQLKEKKFKIVVHDEEGFIQWDWNDYLKRRIRKNTISYVNKFLCWGNEQCHAISDYNSNVELVVTGHPRIDILLNKVRDYNKHKNLYGKKVILINTKFGDVNFKSDGKNWIEKYKSNNQLSLNEISYFEDMINYKEQLFKHYKIMIKKLSQSLNEDIIVIRPHPSENINCWIEYCKELPNVVIRNDESIGYWLHQSYVVIHTGCTTAVESFLMDVPAIAFKPIIDNRFEIKLPNKISINCLSVEDCIDKVSNIKDNKFNIETYKNAGFDILKNNLDIDDSELSVKRIMNEVDKLQTKKRTMLSFLQLKMRIKILNFLLNIGYKLKSIVINESDNEVNSLEIANIMDNFTKVLNDDMKYEVKQLTTNVVSIIKVN